MDFREFSKQYNNYLAHNFSCTGTKEDFLMHYGVKGMKWHDHVYKNHTVVSGARQIGGNKKKDVNGSDDLKRESQIRGLVDYSVETHKPDNYNYLDAVEYRQAADTARNFGYAHNSRENRGPRMIRDEATREEAAQRLEELAEKRSRATGHLNSYYYRSRGKKNRH